MIALDTNLLVYAHRSGYQEHRKTIQALEEVFISDRSWGVSLPCIIEFWSIVTHKKMGSRPSSPEEAKAFIQHILEDGKGNVFMPGVDFYQRLMAMAGKLDVHGVRIFDLQIGLVAYDNGANEVWTHDRGFQKIPGMRVVDPLA
jgi:hypothetical protein